MAKQYYGLNKGETEFQITEDVSTTSKSVEVSVDMSAGLERQEIIRQLEMIKNQILKDSYPSV
jgi:hypothetical protein